MKKTLLIALAISFMAPSVWAVTTYNQSITAIFGSGNPNTGWTADTANNIQLGLRAKGRNDSPTYVGTTPNDGAGTYSFPVFEGARGPFNYEFSINSDASGGGGLNLSFYDFYLAVDGNSSQGITYTLVNPLSHWIDNSYGNNGTANGAGVEGTDALAAANNIAQNSQNITFGDYPGGGFAQPGPLNATYNYELFAVADGAGSGGARLASVGITVVVGAGGAAAVPEAGSTLALLGLSVAGLAVLRFRKRLSA